MNVKLQATFLPRFPMLVSEVSISIFKNVISLRLLLPVTFFYKMNLCIHKFSISNYIAMNTCHGKCTEAQCPLL